MALDNKALSKLTAKDAVQEAFELLGGVESLTLWGASHPTEFYTQMYGKLVQSSLTVSLKDVPPFIINLPWLTSRPGPNPARIIDADPPPNPVQLPAEAGIHTISQSDDPRRPASVSPPKRKDRRTGKRPGDRRA